MKNILAKLLSINPLMSLALVISYITFLWYVTALIWANDYKLGAVLFLLTMSFAIKSQSQGLIGRIKLIKSKGTK